MQRSGHSPPSMLLTRLLHGYKKHKHAGVLALMPLSMWASSPLVLHTMAKGWPRGKMARWLDQGCQLSASTGVS